MKSQIAVLEIWLTVWYYANVNIQTKNFTGSNHTLMYNIYVKKIIFHWNETEFSLAGSSDFLSLSLIIIQPQYSWITCFFTFLKIKYDFKKL